MRSLAVFLTLLIAFPVIAAKKSEHLKSSVFFYKNLSEENLNGWEKDFFKDYDQTPPMSFPDMDILTDNETDDEDVFIDKIPVKKYRSPKKIKRILKVPVVEEIPEVDPFEKPDTEIILIKKEKKRTISDINEIFPETVDKDKAEIPDNEVDRSGRIRKMKELLKKRKGKRRIDKRRIH